MSKEFSMEQLQTLMKCVAEQNLGELCIESEGYKVKIRNRETPPCTSREKAVFLPSPAAEASASPAVSALEATPPDTARYLTSPIVGTFYASASPDKEPFVTVGQRINAGETAFIIESMKVMNEVPADESGIVAELLVESGQAVEYGQNILRLE